MAISLEELLKTRESGPWGYDLSPDGNDVVFSADAAGDGIQLHRVSLYGGDPKPLTSGGPDRIEPRWSPAGGLIACTEATDSGESCVAVFPVGVGEAVWRSPGSRDGQPEWSPDGLRLCYADEGSGGARVMVWDSQTQELTAVAEHDEPVFGPTWSPDGSWLPYLVGAPTAPPQSLWVVSSYGQSAARRLNTPHLARAGKVRWSPAGRLIAAVSDERGYRDVVLINSTTGRPAFLCPEPAERTHPVFSANGSQVAYQLFRAGNQRLELHPVPVQTPGGWGPPAKAQPIGRPEGTLLAPRFTPGKMRAVYAHTGHRDPWELYVQIIDGGHPQRLTYGSGGVFDAGALVAPAVISYPGPAGPVPALLYRAVGAPAAALVLVHDGGPGGNALNRYDPLVQHLISRGVTVLAPDYRGSAGYGAPLGYGGEAAASAELVAAGEYLQQQGAGRVGIYGEGYGGVLALRVAGDFTAAVAALGLGTVWPLAATAPENTLAITVAEAPAVAGNVLTLPAQRGVIARSTRSEVARAAARWLAERLGLEEG